MTGRSGKQTALNTSPYLELNNQGEIIHFELTQDRHLLGRDTQYADLVVPPHWQVISGCHAVFRRVGESHWIYDGDGQEASTNGLFINHTRITPLEGYLLNNGIEIKIGQNPQNLIRLRYFNPNTLVSQSQFTSEYISLENRSVLLGRDPDATLNLDSPVVSRRHATIEPDGRGDYLIKDYSKHGVFVNSQRVKQSLKLGDRDTIRIGPFTLIRQGDTLELCDTGTQIRLDAQRLLRIVKDRSNKARVLLNDLSFAIEPGQFVALVGGSGAGKSTLMRTLLGISPTTKGRVYINGESLRKNFSLYRTQIGYVPQDDIIHQNLTVTEVLEYAAKLRLPPDVEVKEIVQKTLYEIEMLDRRQVFVSQLSGGQRKRVSIGVELLTNPLLFFLDEPTSGLDPGLDKKMMLLLRKLANQGRTVILVTHATANIKLCDRIIFLGRGGRLCYFGPPLQAFEFFQIESDDFADIYNLLEDETNAQSWAAQFQRSNDYKQYVANHLSIGEAQPTRLVPQPPKQASIAEQLTILTQRYFQLTQRDPVNLLLNLLTAPVGIILIRLAIRDQDPFVSEPSLKIASLARQVLFVFTSAALWVGLSSSLQEVVKETAIYLRERLVNLGLVSYLGSKFIVLSGLAILQTFLMSLVILVCFQHPASELISWPLGVSITSFLTLISCMSLGLMVSAMVKNSSQANSALPLILLPQIIFSGVLFKMEGLGRIVSWLMLSRWSIGAYASLVNVNALIPEPVALPDGTTVPQPVEPSLVYDPTWQNLGLNWGMLILHLVVYLGLTWFVQKRKDILSN
ncbi:MAG: ATP-binding cassette domain-containing protein [Limnoraphis robusta]|jgi:ABC-type multidrug transport system ATPase subunit/pSer/pThr/pTyr-binding forkhead associated (FHA) protein